MPNRLTEIQELIEIIDEQLSLIQHEFLLAINSLTPAIVGRIGDEGESLVMLLRDLQAQLMAERLMSWRGNNVLQFRARPTCQE
jgi:hypothetical protein